jgi:pimeloyl-ACP methyl ester carboxylesterase
VTTSTNDSQTIQLRDGRTLGYAQCGALDGHPVFSFHGWPGSRLDGLMLDDAGQQAGLRIISPDRPGMGLSDYQEGRTLLDWPSDVAALAAALGLDEFAVFGTSGGGPYALSCAHELAPRLTACVILCGLGPYETGAGHMRGPMRFISAISRSASWLLPPLLWLSMGRNAGDPAKVEKMIQSMLKQMPPERRTAFEALGLAESLAASFAQSFRQGSKGPALDSKLYANDWGFELSNIAAAPVILWHGEQDVNVPVEMGRAVAAAVPGCDAVFHPEDDHYSIIIDHMDEIMMKLISAIQAR